MFHRSISSISLLVCSVSFLAALLTHACPGEDVATPNLRELVIGKCLEYQIRINPGAFCDQRKDCNDIWEKFRSGFAGQSLCNVSSSGYQGYIAATRHQVPKDRQIFWENVYELVHRYSDGGNHLLTLEDTLTGYIADTLRWCGDTNKTDGIATDTVCPSYDTSEDCPMSAERAFWLLASQKFAEQAVGRITVMLNATSQPIYSPNTYFAAHEAPFLKEGVVTDAKIILINENQRQISKRDSCYDSSLRSLFTLLENKGIHTVCEENPRDLVFLYCAGNPGSRACPAAYNQASSFSSVCLQSYLKFIMATFCVIATFLYAA